MKYKITAFFILLLNFSAFSTVIVQNGLTHVHTVSQNGTTEATVVLKNIGTKNEQVKVYFYDLKTECNGAVVYKEPSSQPRSLNPYLKVSNNNYTLSPGEEYELVYQINLSNNTLSGTLWSIMMIEVLEPFSKSTKSGGVEIGSKIRYGVQLIANVGESDTKSFAFTDVKLSTDISGSKVIEASFENNGDYLVLPVVNIQLFDMDGSMIKDILVPTKKVYPQSCQIFQLSIDDVQPGKYQAVLLAEYEEETIGINIELEL